MMSESPGEDFEKRFDQRGVKCRPTTTSDKLVQEAPANLKRRSVVRPKELTKNLIERICLGNTSPESL